ncbi:THUMP domain-containing protein [Striga hermonthica]|uniref:THUMP domain-containing protein n=1 Tax=Striga hermonthica TaxID=68872 RepID=A0A9N7MMP7_STRHE|nr:THUMP domain-containing protein [Striga hermonthica]
MATENKSKASNCNKNNKKRKNYLPHNKPIKKGSYPLRPGVEGFFITCDGGRERQASHEAINVIDSFYEELMEGSEPKAGHEGLSGKPVNKITKFSYSDSSSSEKDEDEVTEGDEADNKNIVTSSGDGNEKTGAEIKDDVSLEKQAQEEKEKLADVREKTEIEAVEPPVKRQCVEDKSVDRLIEAELAELGDKSKRRFSKLDTGCNGVVFIQMHKRERDPSPKDIVQHMMTSLASTKKHISRFLLRVLPVEVSCYTSEEEIKRAIKPLIEKHFPVETEAPRKFAVLYDARANTGVDRAKIIDTVAKTVPSLHKVDLSNPDFYIMVQVVKTVCLIGVVEKYKELAKYNLRQLSS